MVSPMRRLLKSKGISLIAPRRSPRAAMSEFVDRQQDAPEPNS
jgi:hypothetical protein